MIRVAVVGTGYGAREFLRLALAHPDVEVVAVASTSAAGKRLGDVLPAFRKLLELRLEEFDAKRLSAKCDLAVIGVPSRESMPLVKALWNEGLRVMDLGGDFRLKDPAAFETYYKAKHTCPGLLAEAVYGLPPVHRNRLKTARLVSVPGCYPISAILPLKPLVDVVKSEVPIVIDAISGVSGAGRTPSAAYHFPEMNENLRAYRIAIHQHVPEIEQELGGRAQVQFTPHVAPLTRGILTTITFRPAGDVDAESAYRAYEAEPFVRVHPEGSLPEVGHVRGTNFCDIGWMKDARTGNFIIVSAIDNLTGGTSGMAIQCLNIMFNLDESAGLRMAGIAP